MHAHSEHKAELIYLPPTWAIYVIALFFIGFGLGHYPILDNNEGLYAEIPREMLASDSWRNWVIPHLNGLAYMEKPPLLYWLTALMFAVFGESEWVARLVPAMAAMATVHLIMTHARSLGRELAGKLAAIVFASSLGVMLMSRTLMFDMLLTCFLSWALLSASRFYETQNQAFLFKAAIALALALLAKGFVAILLFGLVISAYLLHHFRHPVAIWCAIKPWFNWRVQGVFFLVALPWHILASIEEPIFPWFYFINEHFLRFLGRREPHDYYAGAWWYYLPRVLLFLFPWVFLFGLRLRKSLPDVPARNYSFILCAAIMPLFFFSISSAKANYYLVTIMPVLALYLAFMAEDRGFFVGTGKWMISLGLPIVFALLCWYVLNKPMEKLDGLTYSGYPLQQVLQVAFVVLLLLSCGVVGLCWRAQRYYLVAYLSIPVALMCLLLSVVHAMSASVSTRDIAMLLQSDLSHRQVFLYHRFEQQSSLPFYLKHPVRIVDSISNDLFWGHRLFPENKIVVSDYAFDLLSQKQPLVLVVIEQDLSKFKQETYVQQFKFLKKIGNSSVFIN